MGITIGFRKTVFLANAKLIQEAFAKDELVDR